MNDFFCLSFIAFCDGGKEIVFISIPFMPVCDTTLGWFETPGRIREKVFNSRTGMIAKWLRMAWM